MPYSSQLSYVGSAGESIDMDCRRFATNMALGIRGRAWSYEIGRKSIANQFRAARECQISAHFADGAMADAARSVFDRDVASGTPGTLVSNGWSQRAYVTAAEPEGHYRDWVDMALTVVLLDGAWNTPHTVEFMPSSLSSDYGKAYTYGYPYDYAPPAPARTVDVPGTTASPFRLVIWGRAVNPSITIGGNVYSFAISVPAGGYLLVDTLHDPVVELVTADGIKTDAFSSAQRGGGIGSGDYAFQPIAPGSQLVSWDDSFGFGLTTYQMEGEIPWQQLSSSSTLRARR